MGQGSSRRHETIRLQTSRIWQDHQLTVRQTNLGLSEFVPDELPKSRTYRGDSVALVAPHITGLREGLPLNHEMSVPIQFTTSQGVVEGIAQISHTRGAHGQYMVSPGSLTCSCGSTNCAHQTQAIRALEHVMNQQRIRTGLRLWQRRSWLAARSLEEDHAASVAAPRERLSYEGPSWANNPQEFHEAYNAARQQIAGGESPLVFRTQDATGGLGARDGGRGFGVEIEYDFPSDMSHLDRRAATDAIGRDLMAEGLTSTGSQQPYHTGARSGYTEWTFERDCSVAGEVVSPIMYDDQQSWEQLQTVCRILQRHGAVASTSAGSHVSVSTSDYDHTVDNHASLVRASREYEDVLFRLGQNTQRRRHRRSPYARPVSAPPGDGWQDLRHMSRSSSREVSVNLGHMTGRSTDRAEFRLWDATLDPAVIQAQINLSLGMADAAFVDHQWGDAQPRGTHYTTNRQTLGGRGGGRLSGEDWDNDTQQVRTLIDRLFWRRQERDQIAALFAATRWERP